MSVATAPGQRQDGTTTTGVAAASASAKAKPGGAAKAAGTASKPSAGVGGAAQLRLGKVLDLGVGYPMRSTGRGVVARVGRDQLVGCAVDHGGAGHLPPPFEGREDQVNGPGPAVTRDSHAYWISQGRLVRGEIGWFGAGEGAVRRESPPAGAARLQVLATDAVNGTQVSATTVSRADTPRDLIAYVAVASQPGGDMRARLWMEGSGLIDLSPDGSGASSVVLRGVDDRILAAWLDARSAMSPVHVRWIRVSPEGRPLLDPDVVVFIGPPQESQTDLTLAITDSGPLLLLPLPKDATHFGLAAFPLGLQPTARSEASWTIYPNGIDPAPVATAEFCDLALVAYARPLESTPGAPASIALAGVAGDKLGAEISAGQAALVRLVSLAARDSKSGVLSWVADGRTFARVVGCP